MATPKKQLTSGQIHGPANEWISAPPPEINFAVEAAGMCILEKLQDKGIGLLMGKAWRNPITGDVQIKRFGAFKDFQVADLWTRDTLRGTPAQLSMDPYLFRPIPMNNRTWIYHHFYRMGHVLSNVSGAEEDAMIRHVLGLHCIDMPGPAGRWAPIMLYVPMIMFLSIAADINATIGAIFVLLLIIFVHWILNAPRWYRICRIVTFPIRLVWLYFLTGRMAAKSAEETSTAMSTFGFLLAIMISLVELILGDCGGVCSYRQHCSYEVVKTLPNRLFICRRHGAAHSTDPLGRSIPVSEKITGMGSWQSDYALIADVKGLIMELRPMSIEDWKTLFMEKQNDIHNLITHRYIGLDLYAPGTATIDALSSLLYEKEMMAKRSQERKEKERLLMLEEA